MPRAILAIQRIVVEAISNALQHARATTIAVRTEVDGRRLLIQVSDDGVGFDPAKVRHGRGLENLKARARAIGAVVEIDSCTQPGSRVIPTLPLTESLAASTVE